MDDVIINWWAIIVSTIAAMIIGAIWYMPAVFGKAWMAATGRTMEQIQSEGSPAKAYAWTTLLYLIQAFVLAHVLYAYGAFDVPGGLEGALWMWLGFVMPIFAMSSLFEKKPWKLFWINSLHHLVVLLAMGVILALWQ